MDADKLKTIYRLRPDTMMRALTRGKYIVYPHIDFLTRKILPKILKGGARIVVTMPPRHGKSELISRSIPLWYMDNFSNKRIIIASYGHDLASKHAEFIRNTFTEKYPSFLRTGLKYNSRAIDDFTLKNNSSLKATGVDGALTGLGADLLIIDDPLKNWKEAQSQKKRDDIIDWFKTTASTRLEPNANVIIIQTRWHEEDLAGYVLNKSNEKYEEIRIPALAESEDILGRGIGDALCESRYTKEDLEKIKKNLGDLMFSSMYQQSPYIQSGNIIKAKDLMYYDKLPDYFENIITSTDLSFKGEEHNDKSCIQVWGSLQDNYYWIDTFHDHADFDTQVKEVLRLSLTHKVIGNYVEDAANAQGLISVLKNKILSLEAIRVSTSKEARLLEVQPIYKSKRVFYPNPEINPKVKDHLDELLRFPNAQHDDSVDAATLALKKLSENSMMESTLRYLGY